MAEPKANVAKRDAKSARGFTLTAGWAALILALLTLAFFHDVALGGKTFVSPDAVAPAGFVRIGEHSLWQEHVYPLWNPFVFLGMPSFGSGAYNPLIYPPDWPLALLQKAVPFLPEMTWMLIYYFLGAFFTFQLAREWGARAEGALLAAITFVFAPNLVAVGAHGHGSQLVDSAYLPLMLWLTARWLRRGSLTELGWLALAGGFQFLRGHVQICFYTWMAIGLYAVVEVAAAARDPKSLAPRLTRALALGVAAALAFGVAGFYNLPLKDYARYSVRASGAGGGAGMDYATQWSMAMYELPATFLPNWVGFGGGSYWGGMPFTDYPNAFVGVIALLLAIVAFVRAGAASGTARVFAVVLGAFSLLVSFGHNFPLYSFMYDHVPMFNRFRIPVMIILLFQLAVAIGAAWGWSAILAAGADKKTRDPQLERVLMVLAGALALLGVAGLVGGEGLHGWYVNFAMRHKPQLSADGANAAWTMLSGDIGPIVIAGLAAIGLAWGAARGAIAGGLATIGVTLLLLFSLFPVSTYVMAPVIGEPQAQSLDVGRDDVVDWLGKQGPWGSFRAYMPENLRENRFAGFGIATINGYHAAKPKLVQDLFDRLMPQGWISDVRWLALLNVRYLIFSQELLHEQTPPFLKPVYQGSAAIYENLVAMPRVTLVGAYGVVPDTGTAAIDSVSSGRHDVREFTWLTKDPGAKLGPVTGGTAAITKYTLHDVQIAVQTPGAAIVRLADLWYPDWTVTVDGKPAEMLRADHALRAVVVPAGSHTVAFHFASPSVKQGMTVSIASAVIAIALLLAGVFMGRSGARRSAEAQSAVGGA